MADERIPRDVVLAVRKGSDGRLRVEALPGFDRLAMIRVLHDIEGKILEQEQAEQVKQKNSERRIKLLGDGDKS